MKKLIMGYICAASVLVIPVMTSCGKDRAEMTEASQAAEKIWDEKFYNKPVKSLDDNRQLIEMFLLSPLGKNSIPPRNMALADIVVSKFGTYAVRDHVSEAMFAERAKQLKKAELSDEEKASVKKLERKLASSFSWHHPNAGKFGFLITSDARNLNDTVKGASTIEEALYETARQHGVVCDYRKLDKFSLSEMQEALRRNLPLLLEDKKTKEYFIAFGSYLENGKVIIMLNDPDNTTIISGPPTGTQGEHESIYLSVIRSVTREKKDLKFSHDIISKTNKRLSRFGFRFDLYDPEKYTVHMMENWRMGAEAWDSELSEIVKAKKDESVKEQTLSAQPGAKELWEFYFKNKPSHVGGPTCLVSSYLLPGAKENTFLPAFISPILTQKPEVSQFMLNANKIWFYSRIMFGDEFLIPTQEELDKIVELAKVKEADFKKVCADPQMKTIKTPEERLQASKSLATVIGNLNEPAEAAKRLAQVNGWNPVIEGGAPASWEKCKAAIQRNIPILVKDTKTSTWKICVGYLTHDKENKLMLISPEELVGGNEGLLYLSHESDFPEKGAEFVPFDSSRYIPYFIHHWEISTAGLEKEVREIFKNNEMLHGKKDDKLDASGQK